MIQPITPQEIVSAKIEAFPEEVIKLFNDLIAKYWNGTSSTFFQEEVVELIHKRTNGRITTRDMLDNHYLDIEVMYRKAGWTVTYEKPGYNETGKAYFTFVKKRD